MEASSNNKIPTKQLAINGLVRKFEEHAESRDKAWTKVQHGLNALAGAGLTGGLFYILCDVFGVLDDIAKEFPGSIKQYDIETGTNYYVRFLTGGVSMLVSGILLGINKIPESKVSVAYQYFNLEDITLNIQSDDFDKIKEGLEINLKFQELIKSQFPRVYKQVQKRLTEESLKYAIEPIEVENGPIQASDHLKDVLSVSPELAKQILNPYSEKFPDKVTEILKELEANRSNVETKIKQRENNHKKKEEEEIIKKTQKTTTSNEIPVLTVLRSPKKQA